jgi:hypothetical protein
LKSSKTYNEGDTGNFDEIIQEFTNKFNKEQLLNDEINELKQQIKKLENENKNKDGTNTKNQTKINDLNLKLQEIVTEQYKKEEVNYRNIENFLNKNKLANIDIANEIKTNLRLEVKRDYLNIQQYQTHFSNKTKYGSILYNIYSPVLQTDNIDTIVEKCNNSVIRFCRSNFRYFLAFPLEYSVFNDRKVKMLSTIDMWKKIFP